MYNCIIYQTKNKSITFDSLVKNIYLILLLMNTSVRETILKYVSYKDYFHGGMRTTRREIYHSNSDKDVVLFLRKENMYVNQLGINYFQLL